MQDDSSAFEKNLSLGTKTTVFSTTPILSSPSPPHPSFITTWCYRIIQNLCIFLAKAFEAVKSPLHKGHNSEKTTKHFLGQ